MSLCCCRHPLTHSTGCSSTHENAAAALDCCAYCCTAAVPCLWCTIMATLRQHSSALRIAAVTDYCCSNTTLYSYCCAYCCRTWSFVHGRIFTPKIFLRWPVSNCRSRLPEAASKRQTVLSSDPEAMRVPESFQHSRFTQPNTPRKPVAAQRPDGGGINAVKKKKHNTHTRDNRARVYSQWMHTDGERETAKKNKEKEQKSSRGVYIPVCTVRTRETGKRRFCAWHATWPDDFRVVTKPTPPFCAQRGYPSGKDIGGGISCKDKGRCIYVPGTYVYQVPV